MAINTDGGTLPGPVEPQPDYRQPRRTETEEFKRAIGRLTSEEEAQRLALNLLLRKFGPVEKSELPVLVADLLDEHREYEIRLGIFKPFQLCNPG